MVPKFFIMACLFALASCGTAKHKKAAEINYKTKFSSSAYGVKGSPRITVSKKVKKGGGRYQVGKSYKIQGKWYHPKEQPNYNKVGMASWYGPNFHGRLTANGEIYNQYALSAAHPTLPLPSYAQVTNLENGSSVVVRVNDRGPFSNKRIIDLSARASKLLDYQKKGLAKVRVRYLGKARMDGRDEKYLTASYKRSKNGKTPLSFPVMTAFASEDVIQRNAVASVIKIPVPNANLMVASSDNTQKGKSILQGNLSEQVGNSMEPQLVLSETIPRPVQITYMRPNMSEKFVVTIVNIPVPSLRPKLFHQEFSANLSSDNDIIISQLDPLGYLSSDGYNQRIAQAFAAIEKR